jgi:hypothetical protein
MRDFLWILLWESVQNLPFLVSFIYATYLWVEGRKGHALAVVIAGTVLGSVAIASTEPLIYREPAMLQLGLDVLVNIVVFTGLSVLAMIYIDRHTEVTWDLLISLGFGIIVALSQAIVDPYAAIGIAVHILSMSASFWVFLRSTRWAIDSPKEVVILARAALITIVGSAIIVVVDYGYMIV